MNSLSAKIAALLGAVFMLMGFMVVVAADVEPALLSVPAVLGVIGLTLVAAWPGQLGPAASARLPADGGSAKRAARPVGGRPVRVDPARSRRHAVAVRSLCPGRVGTGRGPEVRARRTPPRGVAGHALRCRA